MGPTLAWLRRHEPERLDAAAIFVLPKDYLRLRLTGEAATDISDALGHGHVRRGRAHLVDRALRTPGSADQYPAAAARVGRGGRLISRTRRGGASWGCGPASPSPPAAADQCAQAVANGLVDPGNGSVTLGTGGQIVVATDAPMADPQGRIHTFCHAAPDRWYQLGATLSAGPLAALAA